jgi:hypothetical protein
MSKILAGLVFFMVFQMLNIGGAFADTFGQENNNGAKDTAKDASRVLSLASDSMEQRQLQSRKFQDVSEEKVMSACVHVLQDLGFNIENTEPMLGLVKGVKSREAVEGGQVAGKILMAALLGVNMPIDKNQNMVSSIVVSSGATQNTTIVRVTFSRIVWNDVNAVSKAERLEDPQIYQEFYTKLSKSLFLEAESI